MPQSSSRRAQNSGPLRRTHGIRIRTTRRSRCSRHLKESVSLQVFLGISTARERSFLSRRRMGCGSFVEELEPSAITGSTAPRAAGASRGCVDVLAALRRGLRRAAQLTSAPLSDPEPSLRRDRRTGRSLRAPRPRHRARWQGGDAGGQIRRPERPRPAAASARRVACHPRPGLARPASPDGGFRAANPRILCLID